MLVRVRSSSQRLGQVRLGHHAEGGPVLVRVAALVQQIPLLLRGQHQSAAGGMGQQLLGLG